MCLECTIKEKSILIFKSEQNLSISIDFLHNNLFNNSEI
jgi:hypothetical protein